jgi:hypothetical protein
MSRSEHYTVVIRGGTDSPKIVSGNETYARFFINWATVIPKKYQKFSLYSYFRSHPRSTADVSPDPIVYVECDAFQKHGFFDSKSNTPSALISIAPLQQTYYKTSQATTTTGTIATDDGDVDIVTDTGSSTFFHHESKSIPITVSYPHQDMFDVKLTNIAGEALTATNFTNWVLVLDLVPIE